MNRDKQMGSHNTDPAEDNGGVIGVAAMLLSMVMSVICIAATVSSAIGLEHGDYSYPLNTALCGVAGGILLPTSIRYGASDMARFMFGFIVFLITLVLPY